MDSTVSPDDLALLRKEFTANPAWRLAQNAVTQTTLDKVVVDREVVNATDHTFSTTLDDWKVTNQKKSGRCWLFAGLNLLRVGAMRAMNVDAFEFSQNHAMFWDKLERANYVLEALIDTRDRPLDDRTVAYLLESMAEDGGQWNMFAAVVAKHGLVPQSAMPETQSSSETARMNRSLRTVLRKGAAQVRAAGSLEDARAAKADVLAVVYRVLAIHLGTPPESVDWQWTDKDKVFHRDGVLTPQEFAAKYVTVDLSDYVCLVHDARESSPLGRTYTVDRLGNVLGGPPVTYLNVEVGLLKRLAAESLQAGTPVWFGCDVVPQMSSDDALWDARLYAADALYDTDLSLTRAERLELHESAMTHAMLFTGVDVVDGAPRRWRVENSWGPERGRDGFFTMNDSWFDEYVYEIAVPRRMLPTDLQDALATEPIVLPAWDPMGALAT